MTDEQGRYVCYGTVATEHDDNNADLDSSAQRTAPETVVYSTDEREEAKAIKHNGGFVGQDGKWTVVTRVVDTQDAGSTAVREALSKPDQV